MPKLVFRFALSILAAVVLSSCGGALGYDKPTGERHPEPIPVGASGVPH